GDEAAAGKNVPRFISRGERSRRAVARLWYTSAHELRFFESEEDTMSRSLLIRVSAAVALSGAMALALSAQSPRPMGIVDLLSVPRLADPQLSPDGRDIVFTKSDADWKVGKRITHIWRARVDGPGNDAPVQLTHGAES